MTVKHGPIGTKPMKIDSIYHAVIIGLNEKRPISFNDVSKYMGELEFLSW